MFTGIISACEPIESIDDNNGNAIVSIRTPQGWTLATGESVNCNGVCSTVVSANERLFQVEYMPETLRLTTMDDIRVAQRINLERSMKLADVLSGHLVYGHVDTTATLDHIEQDGESQVLTFTHDQQFNKYIISKGSVTVNGISLTVVNPREQTFSVAIIPHTWEITNLKDLQPGQEVNIEYDVIAKYLEKLQNTTDFYE